MGKKWKKALKIIGIFFAIIAIAFIALVIFVATRPKGPPFDDSKLAVHRPIVPNDENGFILFAETIGTIDDSSNFISFEDIRALLDNDKKLRNISDKDRNMLENKYGEILSGIEKSVKYKYFAYTEDILITKHIFSPDLRLCIVTDIAKLNLAFAWHDYKDNNKERGMLRIASMLRLGMRLKNSYGSLYQYFVGVWVQNLCFDEINALLDQNLIPEDQLPRLLNTIKINSDYVTGIRRAISVQYNSQTDEHTNHQLNESYSFYYRFRYGLLYDENATYKKFYDCYSSYFDWTGKPYNRRPDLHFEYPDDTFIGSVKKNLIGNAVGVRLYSEVMPNFVRSMEKLSFYEAQMNTLSAKIALLRYFNKHKQLPRTLVVLVPEYIPAVPRDPFDGKSIRYDPEKKIVYSVGYNLKDDGGVAKKHIYDLGNVKPQDQKDLVLSVTK